MQKALDDLVRHYIVTETGYEKAEKENSSGIDNQETFEDEYIKALYDCLESKGIVRELQTFLRQRLITVLQDKWPDLGPEDTTLSFNPIAIRLVQDFLCCHKLLYTLSVFTSEIDHNFSIKEPYGKMPFAEAESLLDQMEIKRKSNLSIKILKSYLEKEKFSLWECIIYVSSWSSESFVNVADHKENIKFDRAKERSLDSKEHNLHEKKLHFRKDWDGKSKSAEEKQQASKRIGLEDKLLKLERTLENDNELKIQLAIEKYKKEDAIRIQDEIETRLKFEMLAKEKALLQNYEEKVNFMKESLEREKTIWLLEKDRHEKELFDHKERILLLMNSLTHKHELIKDSFEQYKTECLAEDKNTQERLREYQLKEVELSLALHKLQEENRGLKKIEEMTKPCSRASLEEHNLPHYQTSPKRQVKYPPINASNDTIAFLQYSVENQAEEIKQLRSALMMSPSSPRQFRIEKDVQSLPTPELLSTQQKSNFRDAHLEEFIKESKKRCNEIELESKDIERSLEQFRERNCERNKGIINRPSMTSRAIIGGRHYLPPKVPKISVPFDLPFKIPDETNFPALLEQMFPSSRDYSVSGKKYNNPFQLDTSIIHEYNNSQINKSQDAQKFTVFDEDALNPANFNSINLSKLQDHIQDFNQLVNTVNAGAGIRTSSLNTIVENGEKLHEDKTVFSISSQGQYNAHKSNVPIPSTDATEQPSKNYQSRPPEEENNSRQAGGDAHVLVSTPNKFISPRINDDEHSESVQEEKTKEGSKNNGDIEFKASTSGALTKAKVSSPKAGSIDDTFDKSEASVSIRSIMKMQSNVESKVGRPSENVNVISSKSRQVNDNSSIGDVEDISISAPDTSQSQVDDFWNV